MVAALAWLVATGGFAPVLANDLPASNIRELDGLGYARMDPINTPLLHHVATGALYDPQALVSSAQHQWSVWGSPVERRLVNKLLAANEFERHESMPEWNALISARIDSLRTARGYVIPLVAEWVEYDFATRDFNVKLRMRQGIADSPDTYHCWGWFVADSKKSGYSADNKYRTACLYSRALNRGEASLRRFRMTETAVARKIREDPSGYMVFALAEPAGDYRIVRNKEIAPAGMGSADIIAGFRPVKVVGLIAADGYSGHIVAYSEVTSQESTTVPSGAIAGIPKAATKSSPSLPPSSGIGISPDGENWRRTVSEQGVTIYADAANVKREAGGVIVRELSDYGSAIPGRARSNISRIAYNCNARTSSRLGFTDYAEQMGGGAVVSESAQPDAPMQITRGSLGELRLIFACNAPPAMR